MPSIKRAPYQNIGLFLGAFLFMGMALLPPPGGLESGAWAVARLMVLMAVWWSSEALPVPVTSLLPVILLPLTGAQDLRSATLPYADPVIFLLLGGFIVAVGMQRWGLHRRIALAIVARAGDHPAGLIGGFMAASALLSMWISNTATTLMMIPIALSVAETLLGDKAGSHRFTIALFIGIAWSSSIGGLGTIIGTPPNAFVVSFIAVETGRVISFLDWMMLGIPVVLMMVPLAWLVLTKLALPFEGASLQGGSNVIASNLEKMGSITKAEIRIASVFGLMVICWIGLPLIKTVPGLGALSNTSIAILGAVALFIIPAGTEKGRFLLTWAEAEKLPWGVLLLFGGGLSLAVAIRDTGLAIWIGSGLEGLSTAPLLLMIFAIIAVVIFLTELTSNTATTAALVPVLAATAMTGGIDPVMLAIPTAMAASCAFMLPVATAPNAVIYASGYVGIPDMAKAGLWLNCFGSIVLTLLCYWLVPAIF